MNFINIIGTLFDNSINHVVAIAEQIRDTRLNRNLLDINLDLYLKVDEASSKSEKSKGYYSSVEDLIEAIPEPEVGDWAIVSDDNSWVVCRCSTAGEWGATEEAFEFNINLNEYLKKNGLKTINGESLVGAGDIQIKGGTSKIVSSENNGLMSRELYDSFMNIKDVVLPKLRLDIDALDLLINGDNPEEIQELIDKYNQISEFISRLNDDPEENLLATLVQDVTSLNRDIEEETLRAQEAEGDLAARIRELEDAPQQELGTKHIFLTQELYEALDTYERDVLYIVLENTEEGEGGAIFGLSTFPLILG